MKLRRCPAFGAMRLLRATAFGARAFGDLPPALECRRIVASRLSTSHWLSTFGGARARSIREYFSDTAGTPRRRVVCDLKTTPSAGATASSFSRRPATIFNQVSKSNEQSENRCFRLRLPSQAGTCRGGIPQGRKRSCRDRAGDRSAPGAIGGTPASGQGEIFVRTDRRCTARTQKGRRCQMRVVHGERLCRAHHPDHAQQWKAECRKRTQNYWEACSRFNPPMASRRTRWIATPIAPVVRSVSRGRLCNPAPEVPAASDSAGRRLSLFRSPH
jgi:hypothetical protein